jgi:putative hydrolase
VDHHLGLGQEALQIRTGELAVVDRDHSAGQPRPAEALGHAATGGRCRPRDCNRGHRTYHAFVSTPGPLGSGDDPFNGIPIFGDIARLFSASGPINWEIARQVAISIASGAAVEPNVDPLERMQLEELIRVAELHVADATGLATDVNGRAVGIRAVSRAEWAHATLEAYRPLLEQLAQTVGAAGAATPTELDELGDDHPELSDQLLGNLSQVLGPVMMGLTAGSMIGHLAQRAFGQYDLPIPRPVSHELLLVPSTIAAFASDWSQPPNDVRLWVCITEITHHAVINIPHVRDRLDDLLRQYVGSFQPDPSALGNRLEGLDPTNPASFQAALGDPEVLLGAMKSPGQDHLLRQLEALTAAIEGFVDHVCDEVGRKLIASYASLTEALRRRRVEQGDGDRFVERLFGLELGQAQYDRGDRFIQGILERAGDDGLRRLWSSADVLPTPAEIDAPGLWLARIDLG